MATATFAENGHIYKTDGLVVPSVTQVLKLSGIDDVSMIPQHHLERARALGSATHLACQYLDEGDLEIDSIDRQVVPYVLAYQKFKAESGFEVTEVERRIIAEYHGMKYGMCVDRLGRSEDCAAIVLDIKTAAKLSPSWAIQTAAYACGLPGGFSHYCRTVVHVAKDGSYKTVTHINLQDEWTWHAALTVAHWRLSHGTKLKD